MTKNNKLTEKEFVFIRVLMPRGHSDALMELIWSHEPLGTETEVEDEYVEIIKVYYDFQEQADLLKVALEGSRLECAILEDGSVKYKDWESFLHGGFEPLECGDIIVMQAENPPEIPSGKKPLYIIPGRGFGTSSHATTRICLRAMSRFLEPDKRCFDVGAGSGILSIAAMLMDSTGVDAVEIDADSVENALENIELNGFREDVDIRVGSIDPFKENRYPVILINIIAKVIMDLFEEGLVDSLEDGGMMFTSGIRAEESEKFLNRAKEFGLSVLSRSQDKEWVGFVLKKA